MTETVRVIVRESAGHTVVAPQGAVFFDTVDVLRETLLRLAGAEHPRLVLDLSDVSVCDSSGLNLMVQTYHLVMNHGGWLRLAAPQPIVRRALEATNLTRLLPVYDTVTSASEDGPR
jgi:anti-anti-sigma factor